MGMDVEPRTLFGRNPASFQIGSIPMELGAPAQRIAS